MLARTSIFGLLLLIASPAVADEIADRVCPILEAIAANSAAKAGFAIQADLVMSIGGAYDFDGEALRTVTDNIDTSAEQSCPEARATLLKRVEMQTLQQALR